MSIDGRLDDYILTPEGRKTKDLDCVFQNTENVQDAQIVQCKTGDLIIKIVKRNGYTKKDEVNIKEAIGSWISLLINWGLYKVRFDYVKQIDKEPNGKQRFVKSYLKINNV